MEVTCHSEEDHVYMYMSSWAPIMFVVHGAIENFGGLSGADGAREVWGPVRSNLSLNSASASNTRASYMRRPSHPGFETINGPSLFKPYSKNINTPTFLNSLTSTISISGLAIIRKKGNPGRGEEGNPPFSFFLFESFYNDHIAAEPRSRPIHLLCTKHIRSSTLHCMERPSIHPSIHI
jgi:hypothetical protein